MTTLWSICFIVSWLILYLCGSEAGLDYGGLMKELLEEVVSRGFNQDFGLFSTTSPEGLVYPRPSADKVDQGTQLLEFLGELHRTKWNVSCGNSK